MTNLEPAAASLSGDQTLVLPEFETPPMDPLPLAQEWFAAAIERGVREPGAFTLTTVEGSCMPRSRTVLAKSITNQGVIFGTSSVSRKGVALTSNAIASATFYWRETVQQLNIVGTVARLSDSESDDLFSARTRDAQAAAIVSMQSQPLADEGALVSRAREFVTSQTHLERPAEWFAYALNPLEIEFWHGRTSRLHRRLEYVRSDVNDAWRFRRLQP